MIYFQQVVRFHLFNLFYTQRGEQVYKDNLEVFFNHLNLRNTYGESWCLKLITPLCWRSVISLLFLRIPWWLFWIYVNEPQEFRKCLIWSVKRMNWISICNDVVPKSGLWNVIIQKTFQLAYYSTKINFIGSILHWKRSRKKLSLCDLGPQMRVTATRIMFPFGVYTIGDTMMMTEYQFWQPEG